MTMKNDWLVEVISMETNEVVKTLEYSSEREAEHADCGVNRNLNHEAYFTQIRKRNQ